MPEPMNKAPSPLQKSNKLHITSFEES